MTWNVTPEILPLLIASLIAIYVFGYTWQQRSFRGARPLLPLLMGIIIWLLGSTIEALFLDYSTRLFWVNVQYIGIVIVPTAWLIFSLRYTHREAALTPKTWLFLLLMPIVTLLVVWTDPWHHLFRLSLSLNTAGPTPFWERVPGPAFWIHTLYSYILLISGVVILARAYRQSARLHQRQISIMLGGAIVPWFANILFVVVRGSHIDYTPIAFLVTGIMLAWGIFKVGLVELTPIIHKRVTDEMRDGMMVLDEQNRILEANQAALNMLDVKEDILGKEIIHLLDRWPNLFEQFQGREFTQVEVSLPFANGGLRYYQVSLSSLHNRKGQKAGRLIMLHEITRLKQIEASLTAAKEAAEAANRAKSTFLATMSHELRTPLAAIIGYSELIQEKSVVWGYDNIVPHLGQIGTAARHLNSLIGNILDFSKIEADQITITKSTFSVSSMIDEVLNNIQPAVDKNRSTLEILLADNLNVMVTDKIRMTQILINLLGNAAKFTIEGTIYFTVEQDDLSDCILFTVRDTGEGIPVEMQDKIFQPFIQVDSSFSRLHGGSGLGLAISSRFCQMLGGTIAVESELGKGTTFFVRMPIGNTAVIQGQQS